MNNKFIKPNIMRKTTLNLAIPAITEMLLQTLLGVTDTAMVGTLGGIAIAAISVSDNPIMLMLAFFAAIGVGTTALVARFIGSGNFKDAQETMRQSLYISILFSIVFTFLMLLISKKIIIWIGASEELIPQANIYLKISLMGLPGLIITMIMSGALRGAGDTKTPMIVNGFSNIANIIGNYFLIFQTRIIHISLPFINNDLNLKVLGAGWGVKGAAIATTFSRLLAASLILYVILKKNGKYNLNLSNNLKLNITYIRRIFKVGLPAAGEQLLFRLAQLSFFIIVAKLGTATIAAHKIALTAESLSFMPGWGFALASTTLVGQYLGKVDYENAKLGCFTAAKMAIVIMSLFGVLFFLFPRFFILIFTKDEEIIKSAVVCLRIVAISQPFLAATMVFAGGLRGAGDTKSVLIVTAFSSWVIRVFFGYILAFPLNYGLAGAWTAMTLDLVFRGLTFYYIFNKGKWKNIVI